ncbi:MAG: DNA topoisomerase 4 subunit A, partial [Acidimicrobiia bacterium]|nr:DNA topoisomerase 4 subunit A [Acidimicrobiia bacterium]
MSDDTTTIDQDAQSSNPIPTIDINEEISTAFLDYAMSVIVSRALPDVRDGLKPVQRRIVYSMFEEGMHYTSRHKKSANVVGNVMGRYHPHSNDAIYDALVRLGQDFNTRNPLIDPQGNFGTVDDPPAAMRYTECRLSALARFLTEGINEDTVDFDPTYDGENSQPAVLPSRFPNLLVNGSTGIAVGMATNMPPHNLGEVVDAVQFALENPDAPVEAFLDFIQGPDFPTGGFIVGRRGAQDALLTGRGSVKVRAVTEIEELPRGKTAIVVRELPYMVSQDRLLEKIALLVNEKKLAGISDLRNESSSRTGTRLVIELRRDAVPQVVLNQLFKMTQLQDSFGVNNVALVDGVPRTLNVAEMIGHYIDHQMEVIERRTRFRLQKAKDRAHIVEGLLIALDNIDEVVQIIRASSDVEEARVSLMERFGLSEVQAQHILNMPLRRLTALETDELRAEYQELMVLIAELEAILADPARRRAIISEEMEEIRSKHGDERRSVIIPDDGDMTLEDLIADDDLIVTVSTNGYIKSVKANVYRSQGRGGRGVKA